MDWKQILTRTGAILDERFDQLRLVRRLARARTSPLDIIPYRGFGTSRTVNLMGRVLVQKPVVTATDGESIWQNLLRSYQRLASDEIPGARIAARVVEQRIEIVSDAEGYFHLKLLSEEPLPLQEPWHPIELELLEPKGAGEPVLATGEVLIPPADAEFGVISDLDDTVVKTGATDLLRMLQATLLESARTRTPFEGVSQFYRALQAGSTGLQRNPIFYVSSSPWNLYDLLADFLDLQQIPAGPILLGDFGFEETKLIHSPHQQHKLEQIRRILDMYPTLRFVLIGDSGQKDPEIYWEVVRSDPARVLAVYIRDVTTPQRDAEVHAVAEKVAGLGVEMFLVSETEEAVAHARKQGFIAG
jgi:phosphatidate phosphatase APP1